MSKLNVNQWEDRTGREMDIGQRIAAIRGKKLIVGEVLWFTKSGVTVAHERTDGDTETISVGFYNSKKSKESVLILN